MDDPTMANETTHALEPRLATVEAQISTVTGQIRELADDVRDLSSTLRDQGVRVEGEIQKLLVGLTAAAAPKRTDWQALMTGVGLILAIGTAALSPLYLRMGDLQEADRENKKVMVGVAKDLVQHTKLKLHPVGETRIDTLELATQKSLERIMKDTTEHNDVIRRELDDKLGALRNTVESLRAYRIEEQRDDAQELRMWRHPGLSFTGNAALSSGVPTPDTCGHAACHHTRIPTPAQ
jgi:septal ring factor EnvC (AmiA/AmiB activator)